MEFPEEHGSRESMREALRDSPHDSTRDSQPGSLPKHIMEPATSSESSDDRAYSDDVAPVPVAHASDRLAGDVISLDSMRDNLRGAMVANYEQDDLDVPAFLRKRNEVM